MPRMWAPAWALSLNQLNKESTMPVILWLLGVPISLILLFMLIF